MAAEKLGSGHAPLAGGVDFYQFNRPGCTGGHAKTILRFEAQWSAGRRMMRPGWANDRPSRLDNDDSKQSLALAMQECVGGRPGLHGADMVAHFNGITAPVDQPVFLRQFERLGCL